MTGESKIKSERRKHQRFIYKPDFCPVLKCQKRSFRVLNISEGGVKIEVLGSSNQPFFTGAVLSGMIYFANNHQISIEGDLVWIIGKEMGIKLREPIRLDMIRAEAFHFVDGDNAI